MSDIQFWYVFTDLLATIIILIIIYFYRKDTKMKDEQITGLVKECDRLYNMITDIQEQTEKEYKQRIEMLGILIEKYPTLTGSCYNRINEILLTPAVIDYFNCPPPKVKVNVSEEKAPDSNAIAESEKAKSEKEFKEWSGMPKEKIVHTREFPCTSCETGEYKQVGMTQPNGLVNYECTDCGHSVTFP